ncbi:MAG: hypothetical protein MN733_04710 [Nitrososphaera sp.]|nr:hypothetical protein [Nitrososphaera sp.]
MHKNNIRRRQKRIENRLGETVRIASIVQKGMATGRSSYVEMRALERLTQHNIKTRIQAIKTGPAGKESDVAELLSKVLSAVHGGYSDVLTPNGVVRDAELDKLLSIDSEIVTCLGVVESSAESRTKTRGLADTLKELIEERKKLVGSLRA